MKDKTVAPLIELSKDGIVYSINMPLGSGQRKTTPTIQPKVTGNTPNVNPRDFLTEEILMSNSTAKMAELVAKEIYSIRESKNALLRGEADNMAQRRCTTEAHAGQPDFTGTCHDGNVCR